MWFCVATGNVDLNPTSREVSIRLWSGVPTSSKPTASFSASSEAMMRSSSISKLHLTFISFFSLSFVWSGKRSQTLTLRLTSESCLMTAQVKTIGWKRLNQAAWWRLHDRQRNESQAITAVGPRKAVASECDRRFSNIASKLDVTQWTQPLFVGVNQQQTLFSKRAWWENCRAARKPKRWREKCFDVWSAIKYLFRSLMSTFQLLEQRCSAVQLL